MIFTSDHDKEKYEAKVPSVESRIKTFKELSNKLGAKRVVWRYDPLILTQEITIDELISRIKRIGDELHNYTEKLVFSFVDIGIYQKVPLLSKWHTCEDNINHLF